MVMNQQAIMPLKNFKEDILNGKIVIKKGSITLIPKGK